MWIMVNIHADGNIEQAAEVKAKLEALLTEYGLEGSIKDYGQGSMYTGQYRTLAPAKPETEPQMVEEQQS